MFCLVISEIEVTPDQLEQLRQLLGDAACSEQLGEGIPVHCVTILSKLGKETPNGRIAIKLKVSSEVRPIAADILPIPRALLYKILDLLKIFPVHSPACNEEEEPFKCMNCGSDFKDRDGVQTCPSCDRLAENIAIALQGKAKTCQRCQTSRSLQYSEQGGYCEDCHNWLNQEGYPHKAKSSVYRQAMVCCFCDTPLVLNEGLLSCSTCHVGYDKQSVPNKFWACACQEDAKEPPACYIREEGSKSNFRCQGCSNVRTYSQLAQLVLARRRRSQSA